MPDVFLTFKSILFLYAEKGIAASAGAAAELLNLFYILKTPETFFTYRLICYTSVAIEPTSSIHKTFSLCFTHFKILVSNGFCSRCLLVIKNDAHWKLSRQLVYKMSIFRCDIESSLKVFTSNKKLLNALAGEPLSFHSFCNYLRSVLGRSCSIVSIIPCGKPPVPTILLKVKEVARFFSEWKEE